MKKRLIYICMFASLLTFSSCNEALDVAPDGRLSLDEVFQDPDLTKLISVLALTICLKRVYDIISGATIP